VAKDCEDLRRRLLAGEPSPMRYNAPRPPEVLEEDKLVERFRLDLKPENVRVVAVGQIFE